MKTFIFLLSLLVFLTACNWPMTRAEIEQRRLYTETGLRMMEMGQPYPRAVHHGRMMGW